MVKAAFISALLAAGANPNSAEIKLVKVHQPHFSGHEIVRIRAFEDHTLRVPAGIVRITTDAD